MCLLHVVFVSWPDFCKNHHGFLGNRAVQFRSHTLGRVRGWRYSLVSSLAASGSPGMVSFLASHLIERPTRMAMLARCQGMEPMRPVRASHTGF